MDVAPVRAVQKAVPARHRHQAHHHTLWFNDDGGIGHRAPPVMRGPDWPCGRPNPGRSDSIARNPVGIPW